MSSSPSARVDVLETLRERDEAFLKSITEQLDRDAQRALQLFDQQMKNARAKASELVRTLVPRLPSGLPTTGPSIATAQLRELQMLPEAEALGPEFFKDVQLAIDRLEAMKIDMRCKSYKTSAAAEKQSLASSISFSRYEMSLMEHLGAWTAWVCTHLKPGITFNHAIQKAKYEFRMRLFSQPGDPRVAPEIFFAEQAEVHNEAKKQYKQSTQHLFQRLQAACPMPDVLPGCPEVFPLDWWKLPAAVDVKTTPAAAAGDQASPPPPAKRARHEVTTDSGSSS